MVGPYCSSMNNVVGTWGLYPWFPEHGTGLIHPEDADQLALLGPAGLYGKVFQCCDRTDDHYLALCYGAVRLRVQPALYRVVPAPAVQIGQHVRLRDGSDRLGVVRDIMWHVKKNAPLYFLSSIERSMPTAPWWRPCSARRGTGTRPRRSLPVR